MTLRLTFGIDPGLSGAVAALADGEPMAILDMPVRKVGDWSEVAADLLAEWLREQRSAHPGAFISACIEKVGARPHDGGTTAFRFGESSGKVKGVLEGLRIPYSRVVPPVWKRHYGLIGKEKDVSRQLALSVFPGMAKSLQRKKDDGRAEAMLIARWHDGQVAIAGRVA